jgi:protein SCO1/2/putative membrane protein
VTDTAHHVLPAVNATLNGVSAVLIVTAYALIRAGRFRAHAAFMISAVVTSLAFLACYVTYHALIGVQSQRFPQHPIRPVYLLILFTHTILAMLVPPMVAITLWRTYRRQWARHRWIARLTLPIWLYVSVTGVVIYWMLYHLAPALNVAR